MLIILEIAVCILYGVFVRIDQSIPPGTNEGRYLAFQNVNVMMLVGFGYLMAFIKGFAWSALSYTFFINAITAQLYILFSAFWSRVLYGFGGRYIYIQ